MTTVWGRVEPEEHSERPRDFFFYLCAVIAGVAAGSIDVKVGDLLFTALLVLAPCMVLGAIRPERPWRWVVLVAMGVPIVDFFAYVLFGRKPYEGETYGALLIFLPGIAGAYGGSFGRRVVNNLLT
ncbi:MAG TPA: hypothetical protein VFA89_17750 [Terriglobales bacterium]|nr:hypothetical protein [Terriglobales bacterium]